MTWHQSQSLSSYDLGQREKFQLPNTIYLGYQDWANLGTVLPSVSIKQSSERVWEGEGIWFTGLQLQSRFSWRAFTTHLAWKKEGFLPYTAGEALKRFKDHVAWTVVCSATVRQICIDNDQLILFRVNIYYKSFIPIILTGCSLAAENKLKLSKYKGQRYKES